MKIASYSLLSKLLVICFMLFIGLSSCGEDEEDNFDDNNTESSFCFEFSQSTAPYDTVVGGEELTDYNEDQIYEIDLGFSFDYCDTSFQTLYLAYGHYVMSFTYEFTDGIIYFSNYNVAPFGDMIIQPNGDEDFTGILVKTTGVSGNKITTIEYRNFMFHDKDFEYHHFSGQVKFYEDENKITFHYGPNDVDVDFNSDEFNQLYVGLSGSNDLTSALFLSDNPISPTIISGFTLNDELNTWPVEGTVYTFYQ